MKESTFRLLTTTVLLLASASSGSLHIIDALKDVFSPSILYAFIQFVYSLYNIHKYISYVFAYNVSKKDIEEEGDQPNITNIAKD